MSKLYVGDAFEGTVSIEGQWVKRFYISLADALSLRDDLSRVLGDEQIRRVGGNTEPNSIVAEFSDICKSCGDKFGSHRASDNRCPQESAVSYFTPMEAVNAE